MSPTLTIQIVWDGPLAESDVEDLTDRRRDRGLYQVYGFHPVYGSRALLYIGKVTDTTFGERIPQHFEDLLADTQRRQVHVGRLAGTTFPGRAAWDEQINLAEKLLIFAHIPAYNSQNIATSLDADVGDVRVLNWGQYGSLLPEISGERWRDPRPRLRGYDVMSDDDA